MASRSPCHRRHPQRVTSLNQGLTSRPLPSFQAIQSIFAPVAEKRPHTPPEMRQKQNGPDYLSEPASSLEMNFRFSKAERKKAEKTWVDSLIRTNAFFWSTPSSQKRGNPQLFSTAVEQTSVFARGTPLEEKNGKAGVFWDAARGYMDFAHLSCYLVIWLFT